MTGILLVRGAWQGPSCWDDFAKRLIERGREVRSVTPPRAGHQARRHAKKRGLAAKLSISDGVRLRPTLLRNAIDTGSTILIGDRLAPVDVPRRIFEEFYSFPVGRIGEGSP